MRPFFVIPMSPNTPYTPIDCNAYDELTVRITRGMPVTVRWRDADGGEAERTEVLADVFTRGDEEFLRLASGREIRLDRLIDVDGIAIYPAC